jgi:hypothetical protein
MAFIHRFKVDGQERCGERHAAAAEARDCEGSFWHDDWESQLVHCALCDGIGHGQPGFGPCPLEERGYWEAAAEADWEAARGVIPWHEARELAEAR